MYPAINFFCSGSRRGIRHWTPRVGRGFSAGPRDSCRVRSAQGELGKVNLPIGGGLIAYVCGTKHGPIVSVELWRRILMSISIYYIYKYIYIYVPIYIHVLVYIHIYVYAYVILRPPFQDSGGFQLFWFLNSFEHIRYGQ